MEFKKTWEANHLHLKNFIALKVPEQEVPDILQNVSVELFDNIERGTEIRNTKSWLFKVSRNMIADYYKNKSKSSGAEQNFAYTVKEDFKFCACDLFEEAIKYLLPAKYSNPFILSDLYKVPQKEIAKQLGISYDNAKSRIQRARKLFKGKIEESVNLQYNNKGKIVAVALKNKHEFPIEFVKKIKNMQVES